jgi:hypothetical protein
MLLVARRNAGLEITLPFQPVVTDLRYPAAPRFGGGGNRTIVPAFRGTQPQDDWRVFVPA